VTLSAPLRLRNPPEGLLTASEPGAMADVMLPIVFSAQPANEAETSEKVVLPPTLGTPAGALGTLGAVGYAPV
jgi:hypothetical protein